MSMHNAIGAEMLQGKQGKSRFHMYMHVVCLMCMKLIPCFLYDLLAATLMFIAMLPCLGCCLALRCMIGCSHVR